MSKKLPNIHPGEVLLQEFLNPMGLSHLNLALAIDMSPRRLKEIIAGKRGLNADTAGRLAKYFGVSSEFWMGLQTDYDYEMGKSVPLPPPLPPCRCCDPELKRAAE